MNCHRQSLTSTKYPDVDETVFKDEDNVIRGDSGKSTVLILGQDADDVTWIIFDVVKLRILYFVGRRSLLLVGRNYVGAKSERI